MAGDRLKKNKKSVVQGVVNEVEPEIRDTNEEEFQEKSALEAEVEILRV
jgi:hypothetical protein|uniref:Uncharacterized protein n=1 Tax=Fagus sylvatica TaxID=28930 RepID=A0A2N9GU37_FAGSY